MYKDLGLIEKSVDAGTVFSNGKPSSNMIRAFEANEYAPSIDKDYVLNASSNYIDVISWMIDDTPSNLCLCLQGPHGTSWSPYSPVKSILCFSWRQDLVFDVRIDTFERKDLPSRYQNTFAHKI